MPLDLGSGVFDDGAMREFLVDKEVESVSDHLVDVGRACIARVVTWREQEVGRRVRPRTEVPEEPQPDLSSEDRHLYEELRKWRNTRAQRDGRPAYVYLTNRQVALRFAHEDAHVRLIRAGTA